MSRRLEVVWPDFSVYLGTFIDKNGAGIRLEVTYRGEVREKTMTCDEFAATTGFDSVRQMMSSPQRKSRKKA
jgi:hypothetical protein